MGMVEDTFLVAVTSGPSLNTSDESTILLLYDRGEFKFAYTFVFERSRNIPLAH